MVWCGLAAAAKPLGLSPTHATHLLTLPPHNRRRCPLLPGPLLPAGGVLVCAENFLIYKNVDHPEVRAVIPRRTSLSGERGVLITASTAFKQKAGFYIFVQVRRAAGGEGGRVRGFLPLWLRLLPGRPRFHQQLGDVATAC